MPTRQQFGVGPLSLAEHLASAVAGATAGGVSIEFDPETAAMERRIDYGLDGPGIVRAFALTGAFILVIVIGGALAFQSRSLLIVRALLIFGALLATYCFANALLMIWSSRTGKFFVRDRLVEALHLNGGERVLDVGCGRGLVLIDVAKRLTSGQAVGVDLWLSKDLTGNRPNLTLENATAAGVADRVTVETGDMCALPFTTSTFDAVASMTAIHNVPGEARRDLALSEMARVLKPGGNSRSSTSFILRTTPESCGEQAWKSKLRVCSCFGASQADVFSPTSRAMAVVDRSHVRSSPTPTPSQEPPHSQA